MSDREEKAAPLDPPSILMSGLHLAALWALAIVQPLLNLLGNNPDFFVARDNTSSQIIIFVLLLTILPPLFAGLIEALVNLLSPAARWIVHLAFCAVLFWAIALQVLKQFADGPAWPMIIFAIVLGGLLTWAYAKARFMRSMTDILIIAPPVILIAFFFFSDANELTLSTTEVDAKTVNASNPHPVVMVIFDEFPAGSLMTPSGRINPKRFPNFAGLKGTSTWYRNTATDASYTAIAVPSILTGQPADHDSLPTAADHPDSIFTLLGGSWQTHAIEPITQLCTEEICGEREGGNTGMADALSSLTTDLKAVSAHLLLPADMGSSLPDISQSFQGFGGEEDSVERGRARQWVHDRLGEGENSLDGEADVDAFIRRLGSGGKSFDFVHVEKPHYPWTHYPSGLKYSDGTEDFRSFIGETDWEGDGYITDRAHQAHLLEVGFTDNLLGRIISALKRDGRWDDTLFVATADHGAAWTKGAGRRSAEEETMGQIGMVPLFIKAPGQEQGKVVDRPTCTTEIVPRMAQILGIDLPWTPATCDRKTVRIDNGSGKPVTLPFVKAIAQRQLYINRMARLLGGDGADWDRAFRWGKRSDLIGQSTARFWRIGATNDAEASSETPSPRSFTFDPGIELNPVLRQRGTISGLDEGTPLAVGVNGRIAAVGQSYEDNGQVRYSILLPQSTLREGSNRIQLFEVTPFTGGAAGAASLRLLWSSTDQ